MNRPIATTFGAIIVMLVCGYGVTIAAESPIEPGLLHSENIFTAQASINADQVFKENKMSETNGRATAISQFKTRPHERLDQAKKLLPLLTKDMPFHGVEPILGLPTKMVWDYTLFYSSTLIIRFDKDCKVTDISSDLIDELDLTLAQAKENMSPKFNKAVAEFKGQTYSRQEPAKKLIPLIESGMPIQKVEELLGPPDGKIWEYTLADTSAVSLTLQFSKENKLEDAVITDLDEEE